MPKLPNAQNALVEMRKLRDYFLSPEHPRGKHKARVFASALGLTTDDAEELHATLLRAAVSYGERYMLDFEMSIETGSATVRSHWIVRRREDFPRLTSCWVL